MKDLTKVEMEEVKKSMEIGIPIPAHFKKNGVIIEKEDMQSIVSQMKDSFGEKGFLEMRERVQKKRSEARKKNKQSRNDNKKNKTPDNEELAKRFHRNYSNMVEKIGSVEFADSCISDLQELLVLCEVKKSELDKE